MNKTEITRQEYDRLLNVLPPIYIDKIDCKTVKGFAVSEAYNYNSNGVVLLVCFREGTKYFQVMANIEHNGKFIGDDYSNFEYSHVNAKTI